MTDKGHGHVVPRKDGIKARCGGPALCSKCAMEQVRLDATAIPVHFVPIRETILVAKLGPCQQTGCKNETVARVFWPGGPTDQCRAHTMGLWNLSQHMGGFDLPIHPLAEKTIDHEPEDRRDADGNKVTLTRLCRLDPTWAASRIRHLEQQLKLDCITDLLKEARR